MCKGQLNHELIVIYNRSFGYESEVVRWCQICGGVVVDTDVDGRTKPGDVMEMIFPKRSKS